MKLKNYRNALIVGFSLSGFCLLGNAAISLEGSQEYTQFAGAPNQDTTTDSFTFAASTGPNNVFALALTDVNSPAAAPTVDLDGTPMSLVTGGPASNPQYGVYLFALDLGTVSAGSLDFEIDWGGNADQGRGGGVALQLSGAQTSAFSDFTGAEDTSLSLSSLPAGSFAFDLHASGAPVAGSGNAYGSPDFTDVITRSEGAAGNRGITWGYYEDVSGSLTAGYDGSAAEGQVVGAFVVPEPSTYAAVFGALVLAGVMLRRRLRK